MEINIKKSIMLLTNVFILILIGDFIYGLEFNNKNFKILAVISLVITFYIIITNKIIGIKVISIYSLFIIFNFIFTFGRVFSTYVFGYVNEDMGSLEHVVSDVYIFDAIRFAIVCTIALNIGAVLIYRLKNKKDKRYLWNGFKEKSLKKTGYLITIASLVPAFYSYFKDLNLALSGGYRAVLSNYNYGISSIFEKIGNYFGLGLIILLIAYRNDIKKSKIFAITIIVFYGTQMLFGARGLPLLKILVTIVLWHTHIKKISKKQIIICLIGIPILISILNIIKEMRSLPLSYWIENFWEILKNNINENPVNQLLYELGVAIYPLGATLELVPETFECVYGKSYISSILLIIPNLFSATGNIFLKDANVAIKIANFKGTAFGGSIYQEIYYNFGEFSILFVIIIGALIMKLSQDIDQKNYILLAIRIWISIEVIWAIRNGLYVIPRVILYEGISVYFLWRIIYNNELLKEKFYGNKVKCNSSSIQ